MNKPQNLIDLAILNLYVKGTDADREVLDKLYNLSSLPGFFHNRMLLNVVKEAIRLEADGSSRFLSTIYPVLYQGKLYNIKLTIEDEAPAIPSTPGDHAK